ncbi:G-protein coupled receptor dmsr-1-like [Mya arenaria]|uniref:G-protein coupled receptor dmsr-1-like n=1 Tax=Mya arenaria TaxID=6604 RepID=UPI0022E83E42|nr:G-protein coupled receptor dmsr-1-like [Mya arenaria]
MNTTAPTTTVAVLSQRSIHPLDSFSTWYSHIHGYVSLIICAFGISLNVFNIVVLTRKKLQTPINFILTSLAASDIATMISYVPFAFHFYCHYSANSISAEKNSWAWMNFLLVYLNFSATAHTISIWLGVALAIFRHNHVHSPAKGNLTRIRRLIRARITVFLIFISSVIIMIPYYLSHKLIELKFSPTQSGYIFQDWKLGTGKEKPIILISLILYSCFLKLLPCVLIIIYGGLLLITINNTRLKSKRRLCQHGSLTSNSSQRITDMSRTTIMLLIVIVLFLFTELPQGALILCCLFLKDFFEKIYIPLGDAMDIIALINSSVNFVLYCTMSQEFRRTFIRLVCAFFRVKQQQQRTSLHTHALPQRRDDHRHTIETDV